MPAALAALWPLAQVNLDVRFAGDDFVPQFTGVPLPAVEYNPFEDTHSYRFFDRTVDRLGLMSLGPLEPGKYADQRAYMAGQKRAEEEGFKKGYEEGKSGTYYTRKAAADRHETLRRGDTLVGSGAAAYAEHPPAPLAPTPRPASSSTSIAPAASAAGPTAASASDVVATSSPMVLFGVRVEPVVTDTSAAAAEAPAVPVVLRTPTARAPPPRLRAAGDNLPSLSVPADVFVWR